MKKNLSFHSRKILLFFLSLGLMTVISWIIPLRPTYSEFEKRELTKFPSFSLQALFDGSYFDQIDLWFSDTFPFRDTFITGNSYLRQLYGLHPVQVSGDVEEGDAIPSAPSRPSSSPESSSAPETAESTSAPEEPSSAPDVSSEAPAPEKDVTGEVTQSLGAVLIVGDSGYEYYNFSKDVADQYIGMLNHTAQTLEGTAQVYDMVIPTSMDIMLPDSFRQGLNTSSQKDAIAYISGSLTPSIKSVQIYDTLKAHSDEYIYFRTDHHWTALGAYYAYRSFADVKGITPLELSQCEKKEFSGFLGAFYSDTNKNPALAQNPDTVVARPHIARYLVDSGQVKDLKTVFDKYIGDGCKCYVDRYKITPMQAVALIHQAGGLAILAHPCLYKMKRAELTAMIEELVAAGLNGIEAVYSCNQGSDEKDFRAMAEKYHLLLSGGSDFHGANKPYIHLGTGKGTMSVPHEFLEAMRTSFTK